MSIGRHRKTEGGHKRGHSNMSHRAYTSEIKDGTRHARRVLDRQEAHGHASRVESDPDVPRHRKRVTKKKPWTLEVKYDPDTWRSFFSEFRWRALSHHHGLPAAMNAFRLAQKRMIVGQRYFSAVRVVGPTGVFEEWYNREPDVAVDNPGTSSSDTT